MTIETYIAASAILMLAMILFAAVVVKKGWTAEGVKAMAGNRTETSDKSGFAGRADRAANNMIENMVLFGAACIAAVADGQTEGPVAMGAAIFFWARLVYWPVYLAGIPYLRTLIWVVSLVGIFQILLAVLAG